MAIEIDKPEEQEDWDDILWYLYHENTWVYIDFAGTWNVQFIANCKNFTPKGCRIYPIRPPMCRKYDLEGCEVNGRDCDVLFKSPEDYIEWCRKNRIKLTKWNTAGWQETEEGKWEKKD